MMEAMEPNSTDNFLIRSSTDIRPTGIPSTLTTGARRTLRARMCAMAPSRPLGILTDRGCGDPNAHPQLPQWQGEALPVENAIWGSPWKTDPC